MAKKNTMVIGAIVLLVLAALFTPLGSFVGIKTNYNILGGSDSGAAGGSGTTTTSGAVTTTGLALKDVCETNTGTQKTLGFIVRNTLNASGIENPSLTVRIYKITASGEQFVTTATSGASPSGVALGCGAKYAYYIPATSTANSIRGEIDLTNAQYIAANYEKNIIVEYATDWAGLLFKVRNIDADGWVYADAETTAGGAYQATGTTFRSTTSNSSGTAVGSGGQVNYRVYVQTNGTAATDTVFTDQKLIAGAKMTITDFDKTTATLSVAGATAVPVTCPGKLNSDLYNVCWEIQQGSSPLLISKGNPVTMEFHIAAIQGVDPNSDITFALNSAGYVQSALGLGMISTPVYSNDAASPSYVHTQQTAVFDLS